MTIPLNDADGGEPLPICRMQREWLVNRYRRDTGIALKFFSDDLPVAQDDQKVDQHAIEHVRQCPRCRAWFHAIVPADIVRRQRRLTRYCCAGMFVAVEEPDSHATNRITFELFRGEDPCWMIDGVRSFISYCPWCGKKLPGQPFPVD